MKRIALVLALGAAALVCGCASQCIRQFEYYEPTAETAIKTEVIKSGSPDWSDSKSISLISVGR